MTFCGIEHELMRKCGDRKPGCVLCAGPHKVEDHQCGVTGCYKGKEKAWIHVKVQCANCGGGHFANSNRCTKRHRAEVDERKNKIVRGDEAKVAQAYDDQNPTHEERSSSPKEDNPDPDTGIDLAPINWAGNAEGYSSE